MTAGLLINIDVDDLQKGERFYREGLGLRVGRRFDGWTELVGGPAPIYLLPKPAGSDVSPASDEKRDYRRHWTPVHLHFVVVDIDEAGERAVGPGGAPRARLGRSRHRQAPPLPRSFGQRL